MKKILDVDINQQNGYIYAYTTDNEVYSICILYNTEVFVAKVTKDGEEEVACKHLPYNAAELTELGTLLFSEFMVAFLYNILRDEGFMIRRKCLERDILLFFHQMYIELTETTKDSNKFV